MNFVHMFVEARYLQWRYIPDKVGYIIEIFGR